MKGFFSRFPWTTVTLVTLCVAASFVPAAVLEYDRARVAAGEVWRLLTGQMVHWTPRMALFDLGMLLGLGIWLELRGDRRLLAVALTLGACLTALAVHTLSPGLLAYRGSSGLASALFVLAAVRVADSPDRWTRALALTAIAFFLGKAAYESLAGQTLFAGPLPPSVRVVPLVHLLGGVCGLCGLARQPMGRLAWLKGFSPTQPGGKFPFLATGTHSLVAVVAKAACAGSPASTGLRWVKLKVRLRGWPVVL